MNTSKPIVIHAAEIAMIMGLHKRSARRILERIKKHLNKPETSVVTVEEFCLYMGLKKEVVDEFLK